MHKAGDRRKAVFFRLHVMCRLWSGLDGGALGLAGSLCSGTPTLSCARPPHLALGAGLPYPHKEPATCKKLSLVLSFRNPLLRLSARRYVPPQLRHRIEQPSMRAATRCAFWQPLPQGAGELMHKPFSSPLDAAMINVERLSALAGLLAIEDVVSAFANLSPLAQVALFGTFESGLVEVRTALLQMAKNGDGRSISAPF